jgi:PiT family inorganic phosphate transporter
MDLTVLIAIVVIALAFDFTNGFHDAANAIATSMSTRALTPCVALALAAVMNFVGAALGTGVAKTVGSGIIATPASSHGLTVVFAALIGAIGWNLLTWHLDPPRGFAAEISAASVPYATAFIWKAPVSTTHTITSAILGVGATRRLSAVRWGMARKIVTAWILTLPGAGLVAALAYLITHTIASL